MITTPKLPHRGLRRDIQTMETPGDLRYVEVLVAASERQLALARLLMEQKRNTLTSRESNVLVDALQAGRRALQSMLIKDDPEPDPVPAGA